MESKGNGAFVRVATVGDPVVARVLAARLEAEGIEARLHGEAFGPYPMTVGQMAVTQVWVPADRAEEAQLVLLDSEVNIALAGQEEGEDEGWSIGARVAVLLVLLLMAAVVIRGAMRIF